jgi:trehalose 6-phosphate synthase/phosphatase
MQAHVVESSGRSRRHHFRMNGVVMAKQAGRLIVVSSRAPFIEENAGISRAPGGLVSALLPLMKRAGGTWIAAGNEHDANATHEAEFRVLAISIPPEIRAAWYAGASTEALWPLAHGFLEHCRFRQFAAQAYREVNQRVADTIVANAPLRGTAWIHDYQLAMVPQMVRAQRADLTLGFFWHVPWPADEFFRALPWRRDLIEGLLGADVVGLHVPRYVHSLAAALRGLDIPYEIEGNSVVVSTNGRSCRFMACPIGVDVDAWSRWGHKADVLEQAAGLRKHLSGSRLLLAVDRIDYSKGIVPRLEAFERLLERSAEAREKVTLVQIAVPSRESVSAYRDLRERVEATVGRILGKFGTPTRTPLHLFARSYEAEELAAFYLAADVALVTPLRDGMNLVAFEYVATRPAPTGRLLLSELTGAADVLRDAWIVNPYDEDALDRALETAALSPESDADARRMVALQRTVTEMSLDRWTSNFMQHLERAKRSDGSRSEPRVRSWLGSTNPESKNPHEILGKLEPRRRSG